MKINSNNFLGLGILLLFISIYMISCQLNQDLDRVRNSSHHSANLPYHERDLGTVLDFGVKTKALLSTRFQNLNHFKERVSIQYADTYLQQDSSLKRPSAVTLKYVSNGETITRTMTSGLNQGELVNIQKQDYFSKAKFIFRHPSAVRQRNELEKMHILSRRRADIFGSKDVAFYDLAETSFRHIYTPELAYHSAKDSSEKGYINTFNHVTAQAIITSFFSEELADLIGDMHERLYMPELTTGLFKESQLNDSINNPVDNYVDIINNEIGQKLGIKLKCKYGLDEKTICSPALLTAYLNDLQSYYMWALEIGLEPFQETDPVVVKFAKKINALLETL